MVSQWDERERRHRDKEAWRRGRGFLVRGPLPTHSYWYPPPSRPRVRENSLPTERREWQSEEERASREQVERLKAYFNVTAEERLRAFRGHLRCFLDRTKSLAEEGHMGGYVQLSGQPGDGGHIREFRFGAPHVSSPAPPFLARVEERGIEVVRAHCGRADELGRTTAFRIGVNQPRFRSAFLKFKSVATLL
eukprot:13430615-Alexandrium_andersonii.AAC.1